MIRVCAVGGASVHIRLGDSNVVATTNDLLLSGGADIALDCSGKTHIAVIQAGLGLGGTVNVVPYE